MTRRKTRADFYDAETVKLRVDERIDTPTPTGSLSPFVAAACSRERVAVPKPKPKPRRVRSTSGVPSGPWAFALILLGGGVAFIAAAIAVGEPRPTMPAHAPPVVSETMPTTRDAGPAARSNVLPVPSKR